MDARFAVRGTQVPPPDLIVVDIDANTFTVLQQRWATFPRSFHGQVIDRMTAAGITAIAYDVQFTEPSDDPAEDNALIEAAARAGKVVFATTEVDEHGRTNVFGGEDVLREFNTRAANAAVPPDPGGVIRRVPFAVDKLESLASPPSK